MSWRGFVKRVKSSTSADQHDGVDQRDTPDRLQSVNDRAQVPCGKEAGYLLLDALKPSLGIHDRIDRPR